MSVKILKLIAVLLVSAAGNVVAQQGSNIVRFNTAPLTGGYTTIVKEEKPAPGAQPGIAIYSPSDRVVCLRSGKVVSVASVDNSSIVVIKSNDTFFSYRGLRSVTLKPDDRAVRGKEIGTLGKKESEKEYKLDLAIWVTKSNEETVNTKTLSQEAVIAYVKAKQ